MDIEMDTTAERLGDGPLWLDVHGFPGPKKPGDGPRRDPVGNFPTGPEIGAVLPDIVAQNHDGEMLDVHAHRAGKPAAVVFFRSAVW